MATAAPTLPLKIGIDFGGVLSMHCRDRTFDDNEEEHQSVQMNMPDAIASLMKLKEAGHQLYLISYCGERRARETKKSLQKSLRDKELFDGIYFVQKTSYKADVCRSIGCDLMIDDTLKILDNIHHVHPTINLIWFSSSKVYHDREIIQVSSWPEILHIINETLIHQDTRHTVDSRVSLDEKLHRV